MKKSIKIASVFFAFALILSSYTNEANAWPWSKKCGVVLLACEDGIKQVCLTEGTSTGIACSCGEASACQPPPKN